MIQDIYKKILFVNECPNPKPFCRVDLKELEADYLTTIEALSCNWAKFDICRRENYISSCFPIAVKPNGQPVPESKVQIKIKQILSDVKRHNIDAIYLPRFIGKIEYCIYTTSLTLT